jgi:peptidoglycan lytic transglycosylase
VLASAVALAALAGPAPVADAASGATPGGAAAPTPGDASGTGTFSAPASPGSTDAGGSAGTDTDGAGPAGAGTTPGAATVATASANGITLRARVTALLRRRATVSGLAPARAGQVRIEQLGADGAWAPVATAAVAADGRFTAAWRPRALGAQQLRAVVDGGATGASSEAPPQVAITVYRPGRASWYGPGSYGNTTACGVKLTRTTVGVAHKTLPCGTQVQFSYAGRTLVVPVIDRGPFVAGRSWDLTKHTHELLGGDDGLITVGALPQLDQPRVGTPFDARPTPLG